MSTKLPSLGRGDSRSSKISSGNTTTRLLGIFQKIEHVLLVGVAGGVPHYTDYSRHTRRGDIIISYPQSEVNDYVYAHKNLNRVMRLFGNMETGLDRTL